MSEFLLEDEEPLDILLAPSFDQDGARQMRVVEEDGTIPYAIDQVAAGMIELEMRLTGVRDPQAEVMMLLHRGQPIPEPLFEALNDIVSADDPADDLLQAVRKQLTNEEATRPDNRYTRLFSYIHGTSETNQGQKWVLQPKALFFLSDTGVGFPYLNEYSSEVPELEEFNPLMDDIAIVHAVNATNDFPDVQATHHGQQYELMYAEPDKYGTRPQLLSDRLHYALGGLTVFFEFKHIATVLEETHPARLAEDYDDDEDGGIEEPGFSSL